jgi:hypothetical protein
VQVTGAGLDRLDQAALTRLGIPVANVPGGSNSAVAEYAVTSASLLLRRLAWSSGEIARGNYAAFRARLVADNLAGLEGLLVGVVGFGTIGVAVARAFHAAGARLCFHDPAPRDPAVAAGLGAAALPLDELLATADVVTLHVPLLPATQGLIGARELARMKPGAILIQAARGGIVDEAALAAALASGHLGGAAVDVYSVEPPGADNPLLEVAGEARGAPAAHAAHRRRDAPGFGLAVSLGLGERRTRAGARRGAGEQGVLNRRVGNRARTAAWAKSLSRGCPRGDRRAGDFAHPTSQCPVAILASFTASAGSALPRQAMCMSGRSSIMP